MASYLDFEKNIKQLDDDITNAKIKGDDAAVAILNKNLQKEIAKTYKSLDEFGRLALDIQTALIRLIISAHF